MRLHTAGIARGFGKPIVARITTEPIPACERKDAALVLPSLDQSQDDFHGYAAVIVKQEVNGRAVFRAPGAFSSRH